MDKGPNPSAATGREPPLRKEKAVVDGSKLGDTAFMEQHYSTWVI